ncbi:MAG TPA: DUF5667 domain-containing protein, partial [bacterium]|nr:DUF5667 domain-containing protein [bacterium]
MIDKQYLIKQLEGLNNKVTPDRKWKKAQRQILLSQWRSQVEEVPGAFQLEKEYAIFGAFRWLLKPVVMLLVLVMGSGYVGVWASENSLPGDLLYPIKITSEKIQVKLTFDEHKKAELHVELAQKRTEEIKQLKQKETVDSKVVKETYTKVKEEVSEAKNTLQVIKDKKEAEPEKVDTVAVLTSAEKVDEALRNIDESLKNNIGGPVDDEENQLLADALVGVEDLKADVTAVVKDAVAANPDTLNTSTEASEAVNKIIERETKEITVKADSLTQSNETGSTPITVEPEQMPVVEPVEVVEEVEMAVTEVDTSSSVTGTSTSSSSTSATAGGDATLTTETKPTVETSIKVEGVTAPTASTTVVEIKDEEIAALLTKVDEILKTPLTSAQLTDAKALNDQLMGMVTKLVNVGKSD